MLLFYYVLLYFKCRFVKIECIRIYKEKNMKPIVGKSKLFNYLIGKRLSIVEDTPGVTRDRIVAETTWNRKSV